MIDFTSFQKSPDSIPAREIVLNQSLLHVLRALFYNLIYKLMRWPDSLDLFSRTETECPSEEGDENRSENDKEEDAAQAQE
jgi:hypothetical protein